MTTTTAAGVRSCVVASTRRLLSLLACTAILATGCSDDQPAGSPPTDPTATSPAPTAPPEDVGGVAMPDVTVRGPIDGTPLTSARDAAEAAGYVEEEYFVSGIAHSFVPDGDLDPDGRWTLTTGSEAPYTTRILVKRPADPEAASGVVLVEWNNVSAGFDSTPDWGYTATEITRAGHVHIAVSAQEAGVDGDDGRGLAGGFGAPLTTADPERYGDLSHPGDAYSYDLFSQVGALVGAGDIDGIDPLDGLPREHVIAIGESQSAFRLTSLVNGIHPLEPVFDGFLVHSRGGGAAPFGPGGQLSDSLSGGIRIRDDLETPVLVFSTETDLTVLGYASARQPDTEWIRSWEVAGTAHADAFLVGGDPVAAAEVLGCETPVNDGPQHLALKAALSHLVRWVVDGDPPPAGEPIETDGAGDIRRDDDGIAVGGIRLPAVEVPTAILSGDPVGTGICGLFGSTVPFTPADLTARYGSQQAYAALVEEALTAAVSEGYLLEADRDTARAEADESFG